MQKIHQIITLCFLLLMVSAARADDPKVEVYGTIVSIRGGILVMRPSLRPRLTRVSVSDQTQVIGYERVDRSFLRPGLRVQMGGQNSAKDGFRVRWLEAAEKPIGSLTDKSDGLKQDGDWAQGLGTIKSVQPFVFVDDAGKEFAPKMDGLRGVWRMSLMPRTNLLIGMRMGVTGRQSPDGVIRADIVSPERDYSATGTMFGTVVAATNGGRTLTVRPRYTEDTITVTLTPGAIVQQQYPLDPDSFKVGDAMTFWGQQRNGPQDAVKSTDLKAIALLAGPERYPKNEGNDGGVYLAGKLSSLDPPRLTLPSGEIVNIIVPAQMVVARLERITPATIKAGAQVMLVLTRNADNTYQTTTVIVNASPWVGYGG